MNYKVYKTCKDCGGEYEIHYFVKNSRLKDGYTNQCKTCRNRIRKEKGLELSLQQKKMRDAVDYAGGKCSSCGIKHDGLNTVIFDFHHTNPEEKEHNISHLKTSTWERIQTEVDKCILLCSNCHRLEHQRIRNDK